ncbi:MAG TPA: peptide chain release factor 2 [Candidatus Hydrogenedentes bacterium]|jgi:peptide chain release factor 2|nr:peptide chain release factor 2 [Candidatus Hydrogenedentota bacterium]MDY0031409.1 peptide chain release factor 2 [FCB group bacterium]NLT60957.1 peptide chain release factor 2 [Candidatus Hydrogenedentota bacterium]HNV20181.1 peptide chain release factor 2 [Candidatus Hydrogenedentota bacterium]HNZ16802.1 peptide chain release factor 2 [Candidatus Hydrogenedentota bacterium]
MYEEEAELLAGYAERLHELRKCLNVDGTRVRISQFESEMTLPGFWDDPEKAQKTVQQLKLHKSMIAAPDALQHELEDAQVLVELGQSEADPSVGAEIVQLVQELSRKLDDLELTSLFMDPRDSKPALVNIHPGAGGTESCDWASMLYRMIVRYCERREFDVELADYIPGDEAGLKSATLRVEGPFAYGRLKSEEGVHRLVRISPYDANSRRHTSFAAIEVVPDFEEETDIEIKEDELKMDVFRSSGPGGQKVNKTSSAVRLTHLPTGIVVACQIERSQHRNRETALQMLKAKLYDIELKKKEEEAMAHREGQQDVAWGSQIRSYVLHPYQMVKDHRTDVQIGNIDAVLDGDLDELVEAFLRWNLKRHKSN